MSAIAQRGTPVPDALDRLCRLYDYLWWFKQDCVLFRSRLWPWEGFYEVPDRFLDHWSAALHQRRPVTEGDIAELASLTLLQRNGLGGLPGAQEVEAPDSLSLDEFLRFFNQCGSRERAQLLGRGLPVAPAQLPRLSAVEAGGGSAPNADPYVVRLARSVEPRRAGGIPQVRVRLRLERVTAPTVMFGEYCITITEPSDPFVSPETITVGVQTPPVSAGPPERHG
jgi:hypothetical protein